MSSQRNSTTAEPLPQIYVQTPLIESVELRPYCAGRRVFLKLENCQPSGSFKLRGISEQVRHAKEKGFRRVVVSSGGNAGLATAYAALQLDLVCHVVLPKQTPKAIIEKMEVFHAQKTIFGETAAEVAEKARELALQVPAESFLVHPNDHEMLWRGHATMVDEIAKDLGPGVVPCLIVTSCGGGGLICGLVEGIRKQNWQHRTKLLVMETVGTASFNACVKSNGKRPILVRMDSVATSLMVDQVSEQTAKCYLESEPPLLSRLVSDKQAVDACVHFANDHRFLVGPACGTTLSALYQGFVERILEHNEEEHESIFDRLDHSNFVHNEDGPVIVIVDGGAEVTLESLTELREQFGV